MMLLNILDLRIINRILTQTRNKVSVRRLSKVRTILLLTYKIINTLKCKPILRS